MVEQAVNEYQFGEVSRVEIERGGSLFRSILFFIISIDIRRLKFSFLLDLIR